MCNVKQVNFQQASFPKVCVGKDGKCMDCSTNNGTKGAKAKNTHQSNLRAHI